MGFEVSDGFEARVRESFARQKMLQAMRAECVEVRAGEVVLEMDFNEVYTQQHGFMHAGAITTVLDTACGYAAYTLMPAEAGVLTIELKTALMRPAKAPRFRFEARVIKPGRSVTFTEARAFGLEGGEQREVAHLTASMMVVQGRDEIAG